MLNLYLENWRAERNFNTADNFLEAGSRHFNPSEIPKLKNGFLSSWEKKVESGQKAILFFSGMYTGIEGYARNYARTHKDCILISFERIFDQVVNAYAINNLEEANEATVERTGERIERAQKCGYDIILDGFYVDIRERAPLVNTLNQLGFQVVLLVRKNPGRYLEAAVERQALNTILRGKLITEYVQEHVEIDNALNLKLLDDSITPYCVRHSVSVDELYHEFGPTETFRDFARNFAHTSMMKNELLGFKDQLKLGTAYCGAKYAFKI